MTTVQELNLETDLGCEGIFVIVGHDEERMYLVKDMLFCKRNDIPCGIISTHMDESKLASMFPEKFVHPSPLSTEHLMAIGERQDIVRGKLPSSDCPLVVVLEHAEEESVDALAEVPQLLTIACFSPGSNLSTKHRGTFLMKQALRYLSEDDKYLLHAAVCPQVESVASLEEMLAQLRFDTSCLFFWQTGEMAFYDADIRENFQFGAPAFRVASA